MSTMMGVYVDAEWDPRRDANLSKHELGTRKTIRGSDAWKNVKYSLRTDLPIPDISDTQVLIKVHACGICGSDASLFDADMDGYTGYASQCSFPVIIGHEFSGEVVSVGSCVKHLKVGDYVTAEDNLWCGECDPCRSGALNQCRNLNSMGFNRGYNGAMAEYLAVEEKYCWSINILRNTFDDETAFKLGALVEPLSCVYEGIVNSSKGIHPGDNIAILGAGGIGLSAIQLAKTCGAAKIIVVEPRPRRRELAKQLGADHTLNPFDINLFNDDTILDLTYGQGIGMTIEASENPSNGFLLMERFMQEGGEFLCLSMAPQHTRIDYMKLIRGNITYSGSYGHAGHANFRQVINLINAGRIDILPIITSLYPLNEVEKALQAVASGNEGKVMITPS